MADDVKALDQDARGALRKHGIRFGQFTIFMPLLLKPAPTRLRLVLWSIGKGLQEFPESPPPGLVTIPVETGAPEGADTMSGYRNAGTRAIRIDMLERLADMLRGENSRSGFEAKADMLSITGMTLEQFADLMGGLGYKAEKGEREKVKAPVAASVPIEADQAAADATAADAPVAQAPAEEAPAEEIQAETAPEPQAGADAAAQTPADATQAAPAAAEMEVFYTFTWGRAPRANAAPRRSTGDKPRGKGKPQGKGRKGAPRGETAAKSQNFSARPPKKEKAIDPDNPFAAALMGLKDNK